MPTIKNILIFHQQGLEALVPYTASAINNVMSCFPGYQNMFPIRNMGNWASSNAYYTENGHTYLRPYESMEWYLERAKMRAMAEGRWPNRGQISVSQMLNDLSQDPYFRQIPQWGIYLTKHDLYGDGANGFCLGCTHPDAFTVISTHRFLNGNEFDLKAFQTVVKHEFGHIIRLTEGNRPNVYESLGPHCMDSNCMMQQRLNGDFSDIATKTERRKERGLPPMCPDCLRQGQRNLFQIYAAHERGSNPSIPNPSGGR